VEIRLLGHCAYRTEYHLVWIAKYRRRILNSDLRAYLIKLFPEVVKQMPGCEIVEKNIQLDHIHMVMIIPPKYAVSEVIGRVKGIRSSHLREKFDWLK